MLMDEFFAFVQCTSNWYQSVRLTTNYYGGTHQSINMNCNNKPMLHYHMHNNLPWTSFLLELLLDLQSIPAEQNTA